MRQYDDLTQVLAACCVCSGFELIASRNPLFTGLVAGKRHCT